MNQTEKTELLRGVQEVVGESRQLVADVKNYYRERLLQLAGQHLADMMRDPSATERYLSAPQPNLREAALSIYKDHWGLDKIDKSTLEIMAFEDSNDNVRAKALMFLASHVYGGTRNMRLANLMAAIVKDKSASTGVRLTAYQALYHLSGFSSEDMPRTWHPSFRFPEEVDWAFVDSFVTDNK